MFTIVPERKLEEMFATLPTMQYSVGESFYPVSFGYGDKDELNAFLKSKHKGEAPYPLIWLLYPYTESHDRNRVTLNRVDFILAVNTNASMQNPQRLKETYANILYPLLDNIRYLLKRSNIINWNEELEVIKYPNYSDDAEPDKHFANLIWDAIKINLTFDIIDTCYRPVKFIDDLTLKGSKFNHLKTKTGLIEM